MCEILLFITGALVMGFTAALGYAFMRYRQIHALSERLEVLPADAIDVDVDLEAIAEHVDADPDELEPDV